MTSPSTSCIDENAIGALFDHRLSQAETDAIDHHVAECEECRNLLCSMARLYAPSSPALASGRGSTLPLGEPFARDASSDEANIRRLLALLGCERQVGRVLGGKWRLDAVLGVGGMAEVYAATHLTNGRRAAIKLLRREWMARPNVVYRFLREGYVANRISHPGAVTILDDGTADDGTPFLVLELLEGRTIGTHIRERLPVRTVVWIACEILDVLAAAHERGIVHRDIKPENVLLTRQGSVKLLDFGIARMHELAPNIRATQHGVLIGTPAYMPPEQARGALDSIDARTDIWAVGATMFALLAGRPVHLGGTPNETLVSAMKPAPKLGTVATEIPSEIADIVDRALAFSQHERWPDARVMQGALRGALDRVGDSQAGARSRPPEPWALATPIAKAEVSPKQRPMWLTFSLVASVVALLATLAFVARTRGLPSASGYTGVSPEQVPAAAPPSSSSPAPSDVVGARVSPEGSVGVPSEAQPPPSREEPVAARPKPGRRPVHRADAAPHAPPIAEPEPQTTTPPPPPATAPPPEPREDRHPLDRRD
jgi:serine/threonine-protein kinase